MNAQLDQHTIDRIRNSVTSRGLRATAREVGVSANTIKRALHGAPTTDQTVAKLKKLPPTIRKKEDFSRTPRVRPHAVSTATTSWTIEAIRIAIDAQMRGRFASAKRLAEAMRRDDAIFTARSNRTAPVSSVAVKIKPAAEGAVSERIAIDAGHSVQVARTVLRGIVGTLVDHSIAIGYLEHTPNTRGTRIDMRLTEWPLEHVWWNSLTETLETSTREGAIVPITHGDSRWIVFRRTATTPWREDACVLPAGLVWAAHSEGLAHWLASSKAHGLAKFVGVMPEGYELNEEDNNDTVPDVVEEFMDLLKDLAEGDTQYGLKPLGSEVDFLTNNSTAWQVFAENILSREKAAARIFLGTDAILGSVGGAPGVDISALFGVATTRLQGDFTALVDGLYSGLYVPWTAINHGDSRHAPKQEFLLPDPDTERTREAQAKNRERFDSAIERMRANGLRVTQDAVNAIAAEFGITPIPELANVEEQTSTIALAPTDVAKVVRVREARASQGLPPFGDERDDLTITELETHAANDTNDASESAQ
jgi:hypothetical protein